MESIAIFSDVHSNAPALEAVLDDIREHGITKIFNLGDSLFGPVDMHRTYQLLSESGIIHIRGNGERLLLDRPTDAETTMNQNRRNLTTAQRAWLEQLPAFYRYKDIFLCHATPDSDETYLLEKADIAGFQPRPIEEITEMTARVNESLIACGHSHLPRAVLLPNGKLIVNPGSAGMPSYREDEPVAHKAESLTPHAKYTLVTECTAGWRVAHVSVPYDWERAAQMAEANGRPDWAYFLRTGRA